MVLLNLKGLKEAIEVFVVGHELVNYGVDPGSYRGWRFATEEESKDAELGESWPSPDGFEYIDQVYEAASPGYRESWLAARKRPYYSVPILFDKETKRIVSTESADIIAMFNSEFDSVAKRPRPIVDLAPPDLDEAQAKINDRVYPHLNDGVYRCGFARSQEAYDDAIGNLYETLDWLEEKLSTQRYLTGDRLTLADVRAWVTLVRIDMVYVVHFKVAKRRLKEYPNLWNYTLDLYQTPGFGETIYEKGIKQHYFGSHRHINPHGIVPAGLECDYTAAHDRDRFPSAYFSGLESA